MVTNSSLPVETMVSLVSALSLAEFSVGPATGLQPMYYLIAAVGGVIAILGIRIAVQGAPAAGVTATGPGGTSVAFSGITQGVVIAVIGGAILVGALYFSQQTTRTETSTSTTQNPDGSTTTEVHTAD
jgi:hypothetical protein